ncbi:hypothetical protein VM99_15510 [Pseudomonas chlororaphis]|uniref:Carrier domain-containing protein n=1 Tax=Pseudomonas chlororaphis TaxID=587753 RepID=A0A0G3GIP3_9PSED|nr:hypothetical protein VM99_15510 [Pseudomonas chlororaphis]
MGLSVVEISVEAKVAYILSEYLGVSCKLESCLRIVEDLNVDSMGVVEIVVLIGEEFDIEVPPDQVARWRSVMDIINTVQDVLRR